MPRHTIIVEKASDLQWEDPSSTVVTAREFINGAGDPRTKPSRVINLCRDFEYLSLGYYCSLLAEARRQRVVPSVETILELSRKSIYRFALAELDELLQKRLKRLEPGPEGAFVLHLYFGKPDDPRFEELADEVFDYFRCPLLRIDVQKTDQWRIASIKPISVTDLKPEQQPAFRAALESHTRARWRRPPARTTSAYDLAVLYDPAEKLPPSDARALARLMRVGETMGVDVELIQKKDYSRIAEYDALFIRETTTLDHHTFRFAKRAEQEGMPVIDDPNSILRCTNKVYLAELLKAHKIPTPKTLITDKSRLEAVEQELGLPFVLKIPDGSFSRGVVRISTREELQRRAGEMLRESEVILAQEFMYTSFDWRVGVLNGNPIFVCQYFMSKKHWQVVKHGENGKFAEGPWKTIAVEDAPPEVVSVAVKAANLIGNGLYGVDLKQTDKGVFVIEVNDNPNIEAGVEDAVLKDELYRILLREFIRRIEQPTVNGGHTGMPQGAAFERQSAPRGTLLPFAGAKPPALQVRQSEFSRRKALT
jgi:glutathione synthase/RimK-type ligase-like ATP-grasp enzyme